MTSCPQLIIKKIVFEPDQLDGDTTKTADGTQVNLSCHTGYEIKTANKVVTCKGGRWDPEPPKCTALPPTSPPLTETEVIAIGASVGGFFLICGIVIAICVVYKKRARSRNTQRQNEKASWTGSYDSRADSDDRREDFHRGKPAPPPGYFPPNPRGDRQMTEFTPGYKYDPSYNLWYGSYRMMPIPRPKYGPAPSAYGYMSSYPSTMIPTEASWHDQNDRYGYRNMMSEGPWVHGGNEAERARKYNQGYPTGGALGNPPHRGHLGDDNMRSGYAMKKY